MGKAVDRLARSLLAEFLDPERDEADHRIDQRKPAENAAAERQAGAEADEQDGARRGGWIFLDQTDQAHDQDHHRHGERRVLWIHEHVAVEGRAQCQQQQRRQSRQRAADTARQAPGYGQADDADDRTEHPARLEQFERNDLVQQGRSHVEAAAVHIQVGKRQRAGVLEPGLVHPQQEIGIFSVGVVVPAQAVIAEGEAGDDGDHAEDEEGEIVAGLLHRAPRRRLEGRRRNR